MFVIYSSATCVQYLLDFYFAALLVLVPCSNNEICDSLSHRMLTGAFDCDKCHAVSMKTGKIVRIFRSC